MTFPDLIVTNARIVTFDPARPNAEAIAIAGGGAFWRLFRAVFDRLAGSAMRVVNLAGRMVLPGL